MSSYDAKQIGAVLKACLSCGVSYYFTDLLQVICVRCNDKDQKATRVDRSSFANSPMATTAGTD